MFTQLSSPTGIRVINDLESSEQIYHPDTSEDRTESYPSILRLNFGNVIFIFRINHVLECEFYLLEVMDCCLVLYHAYRPLVQYVADIGQESDLLSTAWKASTAQILRNPVSHLTFQALLRSL